MRSKWATRLLIGAGVLLLAGTAVLLLGGGYLLMAHHRSGTLPAFPEAHVTSKP